MSDPPSWLPRLSRGVRATLVALGTLAIPGGLLYFFGRDIPVAGWPLWPYLAAAALTTLFASSCLVFGHFALKTVLKRSLPLAEHALIAFALGAFTFQLALWVLGFAGWLGRFSAFVVPVLLLAAGARAAFVTSRRARRLTRCYRGVGRSTPRAGAWAILVGGAVLLAFVARTMTTTTIGFDSAWYHLPIAETYAARGAVRAFGEGLFMGAYPQMASMFYAWALLTANGTALGATAAAQIELLFCCVGILGASPIARRLLGGTRVPWAFALIAAFPGVYLYAVCLAADFFVVGFAPALTLLSWHVFREFERRYVVLWAVVLSATLLVKYTAICLCAFPVVVLFGRALWLIARSPRAVRLEVLRNVGLAALIGLVATSPQWLRNLVFYGNPTYPILHTRFGGPWTRAAEDYDRWFWMTGAIWRPGPGWEGKLATLKTLFTFAIEPHEWAEYNPGRPMWGLLFTLTLPVLLVLREARRTLVLHLGVLVGVAAWYSIHHNDRYLLALLPWMMAVTAATLLLVWKKGPIGKFAAVSALVMQIAWGGEWFIKTIPFSAVQTLLATRKFADWEAIQLRTLEPWNGYSKVLPRDATLLVHDDQAKFGVRRATVSDAQGFQGGLSYVELATDARVFDALASLGVTHLHATPYSRAFDTLGADLVFHGFVARHAKPTGTSNLWKMPRKRPAAVEAASRLVFINACSLLPETPGLYRVMDLSRPGLGTPPPTPAKAVTELAPTASAAEIEQLLERAEFLVLGTSCSPAVPAAAAAKFRHIAARTGLNLSMRR